MGMGDIDKVLERLAVIETRSEQYLTWKQLGIDLVGTIGSLVVIGEFNLARLDKSFDKSLAAQSTALTSSLSEEVRKMKLELMEELPKEIVARATMVGDSSGRLYIGLVGSAVFNEESQIVGSIASVKTSKEGLVLSVFVDVAGFSGIAGKVVELSFVDVSVAKKRGSDTYIIKADITQGDAVKMPASDYVPN
jgi:hypothetical protein